jgi:cytochrome c oxidase subunit 1
LMLLFNVLHTILAGKRDARDKVWDGAEGLEWTVPSPAPYHTFSTPPHVK